MDITSVEDSARNYLPNSGYPTVDYSGMDNPSFKDGGRQRLGGDFDSMAMSGQNAQYMGDMPGGSNLPTGAPLTPANQNYGENYNYNVQFYNDMNTTGSEDSQHFMPPSGGMRPSYPQMNKAHFLAKNDYRTQMNTPNNSMYPSYPPSSSFNQQRFPMSGQTISQQGGPTPTLNQLLQTNAAATQNNQQRMPQGFNDSGSMMQNPGAGDAPTPHWQSGEGGAAMPDYPQQQHMINNKLRSQKMIDDMPYSTNSPNASGWPTPKQISQHKSLPSPGGSRSTTPSSLPGSSSSPMPPQQMLPSDPQQGQGNHLGRVDPSSQGLYNGIVGPMASNMYGNMSPQGMTSNGNMYPANDNSMSVPQGPMGNVPSNLDSQGGPLSNMASQVNTMPNPGSGMYNSMSVQGGPVSSMGGQGATGTGGQGRSCSNDSNSSMVTCDAEQDVKPNLQALGPRHKGAHAAAQAALKAAASSVGSTRGNFMGPPASGQQKQPVQPQQLIPNQAMQAVDSFSVANSDPQVSSPVSITGKMLNGEVTSNSSRESQEKLYGERPIKTERPTDGDSAGAALGSSTDIAQNTKRESPAMTSADTIFRNENSQDSLASHDSSVKSEESSVQDSAPQKLKPKVEMNASSYSSTPISAVAPSPSNISSSSFHDEFENISRSPSWPGTPSVHENKKPTQYETLNKQYEMGDEPGRKMFLDRLIGFMEERGTPLTNGPVISKHPVDLLALYGSVQARGGLVEVTKNKKWKEVSNSLNIGGSSSAGVTVRKNYIKFLFPFECKYDRGGMDPQPIIQQIESGVFGKKQKQVQASAPASSMDTIEEIANIDPYFSNVMPPNQTIGPNAHMLPPSAMNMNNPHHSGMGPNHVSSASVPMYPDNRQLNSGNVSMMKMENSNTNMNMNSYESVSVEDPFADPPQNRMNTWNSYNMSQQSVPAGSIPMAQSVPTVSSTPQGQMAQGSTMPPTMSPRPMVPRPQMPGHGGPGGHGQPVSSSYGPKMQPGQSMPQGQLPMPSPHSMASGQAMPSGPSMAPRFSMAGPGSTMMPGSSMAPSNSLSLGQSSTPGPHYSNMPPNNSNNWGGTSSMTSSVGRTGYYDQSSHSDPCDSYGRTYTGGVTGKPPMNAPRYPGTHQDSDGFGMADGTNISNQYSMSGGQMTTPYQSGGLQPYKSRPPEPGYGSGVGYNNSAHPQQPPHSLPVPSAYPPPSQKMHADFDGVGLSQGKKDQRSTLGGYGMLPNMPPDVTPSQSSMQQYIVSRAASQRMSPDREKLYYSSPMKMQSGKPSPQPHRVFPVDSVEAVQPVFCKRRKLTSKDLGQVDPWEIMMCLKSGLLSESTWAIDTLTILLYDDSTVTYFGLKHLPGLLDVLLDHFRRYLIEIFQEFEELEFGFENRLEDKYEKTVDNCDDDSVAIVLDGFNYTSITRHGKEVIVEEKEEDVNEPKDWNSCTSFESGRMSYVSGRRDISTHILTCTDRNDISGMPERKCDISEDNMPVLSKSDDTTDETNNEETVDNEPAQICGDANEEGANVVVEVEAEVREEHSEETQSQATQVDTFREKVDTISGRKPLFASLYGQQYNLDVTRKRRLEDDVFEEPYIRDDAPLNLLSETHEDLTRRCVAVSNVFRNLSFIPGNDADMSKHPTLMYILGRLLLLRHKNILNTESLLKSDPSQDDATMDLQKAAIDDWWWDCLQALRENTFIVFANIAGQLELSKFPEEICRPILNGLLFWATCPAAYAVDPLPTMSVNSVLSPKRLVLETMCKLCVHDPNVDLLLMTPPFSRTVNFVSTLLKLFANRGEQVVREFALVLLSALAQSESIAARLIILHEPSIGLLLGFIEAAEHRAVQIVNTQGVNSLRDNPEMMGTSLDMLRRAASILVHVASVPENKALFKSFQERILGLVMSQFIDQQVASLLADVLFECSE